SRIVALGEVSTIGRAPHLSGHVLGLEQVLDADWHSVNERERTPDFPAQRAGVGSLASARLVQRGKGFDHRLALVDRLEAALEIGPRRVDAIAKLCCRIVERERFEGG